MKTSVFKPFIVSLALFWPVFSATSYGQDMLARLNLTSQVDNTIVRNCGDTSLVSYVETSNEHLFVRYDNAMNVFYTVDIPMNYYILDFEIYRGKVFFCGYNMMAQYGQEGLIGFFSIDSLCKYTNDVYIYDNISWGPNLQQYVNKFTEMEVFDNYPPGQPLGNDMCIVLIGVDDKTHHVIAEVRGSYNSPSGWNFALGYNSTGCKETFEQVSVTASYVVTAGTVFNDKLNGIGFRIFDRTGSPDMFSGTPIYNDVYRYATDNTIVQPVPLIDYPLGKHFEMTALENDNVATLSFCVHQTSGVQPQTYYGVLLNVYDMAQTLGAAGVNCLYSMYDPPTYVLGPSHISDLRHWIDPNTGTRNLLAQLSLNLPGYAPVSLCGIVPYMQPLPVTFTYYSTSMYDMNRIVLTDNGNTYLSSGNFGSFSPNEAAYYKYDPSNTPNCGTKNMHNLSAPCSLVSKYDQCQLKVFRGTFGFSPKEFTCPEYNADVICN